MSDEEPIPCGHCGEDAKAYGDSVVAYQPWRLCRVQCRNCGVGTGNYPTREQAIAAWNRRVPVTLIPVSEPPEWCDWVLLLVESRLHGIERTEWAEACPIPFAWSTAELGGFQFGNAEGEMVTATHYLLLRKGDNLLLRKGE